MPGDHDGPAIYTPRTIGELLTGYARNPDAVLYGGGTWMLESCHRRKPELPRKLIALKGIEELNRITRNERSLEIGACVTLARILEIGSHIVQDLIYRAIQSIATPAVRNLATLGGNLCVPEQRMTLFPVLLMLDAKAELRSSGHSRWVTMQRLPDSDGRIRFRTGEVLTRIRIPMTTWPIQYYRAVQSGLFQDVPLLRCFGVAGVQKEILSDIRVILYTRDSGLIRFRELEANLVGRKLPLPSRDIQHHQQMLHERLEEFTPPLNRFIHVRGQYLFGQFLNALNPVEAEEAF